MTVGAGQLRRDGLVLEVRRAPVQRLEVRAAGGDTLRVRGWASTTEQPYDVGPFTETIARGAFRSSLARADLDVPLLINHGGLPLARTTNGSLRLTEDGAGLRFDAVLDPGDPVSATVAGKLRSGLLDQCSFAFRVLDDVWDDARTTRRIRDLDLHRGDVSIVAMGANPRTPVSVVDEPASAVVPAPRQAKGKQPARGALSADLARARAWALIHRR